jgi:hypothetical protein
MLVVGEGGWRVRELERTTGTKISIEAPTGTNGHQASISLWGDRNLLFRR